MICVIVFYFVFMLIIEVMILMYVDWRVFSIVCEMFFIFLSFILFVSFIYSGRIIFKFVYELWLLVCCFSGISGNFRINLILNVVKFVKIIYIIVFLGIICVVLKLYVIFVLYNMYFNDGVGIFKFWFWFLFEMLYRFVEFGFGCIMVYVNLR